MRIAILAPLVTPIREPQQGGAQAVVADLAAGLTARGHQVDVFAARGSSIPGANVVDTGIQSEELAASAFRHDRPGTVRPEVTQAFARAYGLITRGRYDVVHSHAFDAPAIMLGTEAGLPVIHTLHLPPDSTIASALQAASGSQRSPVVATVSRWCAEAWRGYVRIDAILNNGVPLDRITWSSEGGKGALFAGRFSPEKGALEAVDIAHMAGMALTLIGNPYDPGYTAELQERCRTQRSVTLEASVPRHRLWSRMRTSLAVLCPARWDEPFGLVAAEAQAAGTPVVAFARGGLVEVIVDKLTGALIPEGDLEAAAVALSNAGAFERKACRQHAEARLDLENTLDAHENLYYRTVARHRGDVPA
jgi:UDP-glucose:tetrahydrobiopterin glucosyltransferase